MRKTQTGFTLIELVIVIVILGILAVVAIPKYIDLTTEAQTAATIGVGASLSAANAVNYASRKTNSAVGVPVANCTDVANALAGGLPSNYTITATAVTVDNTIGCTLNGPNATTTTFLATGIS